MNSKRTDLELVEWAARSAHIYYQQMALLKRLEPRSPPVYNMEDIHQSHLNGIAIGVALAQVHIAQACKTGAIPSTAVMAVRRAIDTAIREGHPAVTRRAFDAIPHEPEPGPDTSPAS